MHPWQEYELTFTSEREYLNPYTEVNVHAEFIHSSGVTLRRPAFWDGGHTWKIRFASPLPSGQWAAS